MNKIKLMYDVVKTMQKKEGLEGKAEIKVVKDGKEHISFEKEFIKSFDEGESKARIKATVNTEGKKIEHESSTMIKGEGCLFHRKRFNHRHSLRNKGVKAKLARIAFVLNLLNKMEVEEVDSQKILVINVDSEQFLECCNEKIQECVIKKDSCHYQLEELENLKEAEAQIKIIVNDKNNVEKVEISAQGEYLDNEEQIHNIKLEGNIEING